MMKKEIEKLYEIYLESGVVSTDTRQIQPGSIFFALKGASFNANEFAADALKKGARYAVIDDEKYLGKNCILVSNVLSSLQQLARRHRDELNIPVIALTGSNGKTTSKELLSVVLNQKYKTRATKGNLNNHIGVPLTILALDKSTEIAVVEMGANHVGEIALLCDIANPTHGFITNIGKAHIGTFGGFDNIIRAKCELYQHLLGNNGQVFINSQNPYLMPWAKKFKSPLFYPAHGDYYHMELIGCDPYLKVKTERGSEIQTALIGAYNFENIAAALCIGKYFGVGATQAEQAIGAYTPGNMRSQILKKGTNIIILDAYNANPSSMEAALNNLATMRAEKKVVIVGDMFELEEEAETEHKNILKLVKEKKFAASYFCGNNFSSVREEMPNAQWFTKKEALMEALKRDHIENATILIKASRGIGLESVLEVL